jgi:low affinity Fe/Cu permease
LRALGRGENAPEKMAQTEPTNHSPTATQLVRGLARLAPSIVGSQGAFLVVLATTVAWIAVGPFAGFSDAWLLVPSAVASIVALLLVVLLQYSQNRDTRAIQLKLDELIRSFGDARTQLLRLERLSDEELTALETEFEKLSERDPA